MMSTGPQQGGEADIAAPLQNQCQGLCFFGKIRTKSLLNRCIVNLLITFDKESLVTFAMFWLFPLFNINKLFPKMLNSPFEFRESYWSLTHYYNHFQGMLMLFTQGSAPTCWKLPRAFFWNKKKKEGERHKAILRIFTLIKMAVTQVLPLFHLMYA